jgi:hypothetical protein
MVLESPVVDFRQSTRGISFLFILVVSEIEAASLLKHKFLAYICLLYSIFQMLLKHTVLQVCISCMFKFFKDINYFMNCNTNTATKLDVPRIILRDNKQFKEKKIVA